jgi:hypothetical protein
VEGDLALAKPWIPQLLKKKEKKKEKKKRKEKKTLGQRNVILILFSLVNLFLFWVFLNGLSEMGFRLLRTKRDITEKL